MHVYICGGVRSVLQIFLETHIHRHSLSLSHTHTHTHTQIYIYIYIYIYACARACVCVYVPEISAFNFWIILVMLFFKHFTLIPLGKA